MRRRTPVEYSRSHVHASVPPGGPKQKNTFRVAARIPWYHAATPFRTAPPRPRQLQWSSYEEDHHGLSHLYLSHRAPMRRLRVVGRTLSHPARAQARGAAAPGRRGAAEGTSGGRRGTGHGPTAALSPQGGHTLRAGTQTPHPPRLLRARQPPHRALRRLPGGGAGHAAHARGRGRGGRPPGHQRLCRGPRPWPAAPRDPARGLADERGTAHARGQRQCCPACRPAGTGRAHAGA